MQYFDAISETTKWSLFISKENQSITWWTKSMPRPVTLKTEVGWFYEDLHFRTNIQKDFLSIIGNWNANVGGQEIPGIIANVVLEYRKKQRKGWVLPREHTAYSKHTLPTTQEKTLHMDLTRWSTSKSDWLYSWKSKMKKLYTISKNKTGGWL